MPPEHPIYSNVVVGIDGCQGGRDAAALVAALGDDGALVSSSP